jgi:hypothetical protein
VQIVANITMQPENQAIAIQRNYHKHFVDLVNAPSTPLLLAKTASFVLCNLCTNPATHPVLARDGVVGALDKVLGNEYTKRQVTKVSLTNLSMTCGNSLDTPRHRHHTCYFLPPVSSN